MEEKEIHESIRLSHAEDHLFIALDVDTLDQVKDILNALGPRYRSYKVGMQLFYQEGPKAISWLVEQGCRVFADLKFHDIPNTVFGAVRAVTKLGVYMTNVHVAGGLYMMQRAHEAAKEASIQTGLSQSPILLGVTQLTSTSQTTLSNEIGIQKPIDQIVLQYAGLARDAGLDGVVASAKEAQMIREHCGSKFVILTPGIRPSGSEKGDQQRVATPREAISFGADFLVVGRPIVSASSPSEAADAIAAEVKVAFLENSGA